MTESRWIELDGAVNVRDLGGLPTSDGRQVQPARLIRSDNLQELTAADVRHLVDNLRVRAVADLRTSVEVNREGPGPLTKEPQVKLSHLSLFPEAGANTDAVAAEQGRPALLPWQDSERPRVGDGSGDASVVYLNYLQDRPEAVIDALRLIAYSDGATIVHCAAGKDRTGVVVALALAEVGVEPGAIVDDYVLSAERIEAVLNRLAARATYAPDVVGRVIDPDKHRPRADTMRRLLVAIDEQHGGVPAWLRAHGWTEEDAAALRRKLLD